MRDSPAADRLLCRPSLPRGEAGGRWADGGGNRRTGPGGAHAGSGADAFGTNADPRGAQECGAVDSHEHGVEDGQARRPILPGNWELAVATAAAVMALDRPRNGMVQARAPRSAQARQAFSHDSHMDLSIKDLVD